MRCPDCGCYHNNPSSLEGQLLRERMRSQIINLRQELDWTVDQLASAIRVMGIGLQQYDKLNRTGYWRNLRHYGSRRPNEGVLKQSIRQWEKGKILPNWESLILLKLIAIATDIPLDIPEGITPSRYKLKWGLSRLVTESPDPIATLNSIWMLGYNIWKTEPLAFHRHTPLPPIL